METKHLIMAVRALRAMDHKDAPDWADVAEMELRRLEGYELHFAELEAQRDEAAAALTATLVEREQRERNLLQQVSFLSDGVRKLQDALDTKTDALAERDRELEKVQELVKEIEWSYMDRYCPICGSHKGDGHDDTCKLAMALTLAESETNDE